MKAITFLYDVPLDQTMVFETIYPEPLQLHFEEKQEIRDAAGSIFVWMYESGELVGESYGIPLQTCDEAIEGLEDLSESERQSGIYCYSNSILPPFQRRGLGAILKSHWLGLVAAHEFKSVYGHARPGGSQQLNAKFGAEFLAGFSDWYGTGEEYKLYRLVLSAISPATAERG